MQRIFAWFAAGLSSIEIAKRLNEEGVPGPRGGQWNASTIRGDPKKLVGILNNPLYAGRRLVWGRRPLRHNPDSEQRERRYRLRDSSEWVGVAVPDLRIVDDKSVEAAQAEVERRQRPASLADSLARQNRQRHLLSGLIRCGWLRVELHDQWQGFTAAPVTRSAAPATTPFPSARKRWRPTISILQHSLLTEEHARLFVAEFGREMTRLTRGDDHRDEAATVRLRQIEAELASLYQNLLAGLASPAVRTMIEETRAEKVRLEASIGTQPKPMPQILPHPALLELFVRAVEALTATLDDVSVRTEAAQVLSTLIERVTIYPAGERGPEAEVVARVADLMAYATNDNAAPGGGAALGVPWCWLRGQDLNL